MIVLALGSARKLKLPVHILTLNLPTSPSMLPQSKKKGSPGVGEDNKVNGPKETAEVEETTALSN